MIRDFYKNNQVFSLILIIIVLYFVRYFFSNPGKPGLLALLGSNKKAKVKDGEANKEMRVLYTRSLGKKESALETKLILEASATEKPEEEYRILYTRSLGPAN
ncbi:MAG: hypothetical protein PWQ67_861 [Clostridia bacterium]|jgi:hypothetical protein|nr:hypothetical protein [Clostridia bacterium]MDN5322407.1 hypothetical protein [Clostridia bacterium]